VAAAVTVLDQARSRLGQPGYTLPADFSQLTPAEQAFVLTNLDRVLYGLHPIPGLTPELDQAAAAGAALDQDPVVNQPSLNAMASNWAGGYRDLPLAYEAWMYDDGPGGVNLDCTALNRSGCWGHRDNVLWVFSGSGPVAMGAAALTDSRGTRSYAMVIVQGDSSYQPNYTYTWSQAQADGAGTGAANTPVVGPAPGISAATVLLRITRLRVRKHSLSARIVASPATRVSCSLTRARSDATAHYRRCGHAPVFRQLRRGVYTLRVHAAGEYAIREVRIR
jgi:hypothetical protein